MSSSFDALPDEIKEYIYELWALERAKRVQAAMRRREWEAWINVRPPNPPPPHIGPAPAPFRGSMSAPLSRVVALIDMDCFYCACERALDPSLNGVPLAVLQYNPFQGDGSASASGVVSLPATPAAARIVVKNGKLRMPSAANGSIIAVSYEARRSGVKRCPSCHRLQPTGGC